MDWAMIGGAILGSWVVLLIFSTERSRRIDELAGEIQQQAIEAAKAKPDSAQNT